MPKNSEMNMKHRVAVMVDGNTVNPIHAGLILREGKALGVTVLGSDVSSPERPGDSSSIAGELKRRRATEQWH